jgi:hypothetical protein
VATTFLDRQGDKLSVGALRDMARQVSDSYIPTTVEHDIRYPPIARAARDGSRLGGWIGNGGVGSLFLQKCLPRL